MKQDLKDKYLLDKILHDYKISNDVFHLSNLKVIFLLREPESTIKSVISMGFLTGVEWCKDPTKATDYYCSRLSNFEECAKKIQGRYFFIESNDLVDDTEVVLDRLTHWLGLKEPLRREYSTFPKTGKPGYGDPSENIHAGFIKKTRGYPDIQVPPELLQRGQSCYLRCADTLFKGR